MSGDSWRCAGGSWRGWQKSCGTLERRAGTGLIGLDAGAPGLGIFFCGEFGDRNLVVVRIAEVIGAIHVGAAIGLGGQMDPAGAAVAEAGEIVAFQDVQRAEQDDSARRGRRCADDGVVVECADDRGALDDVVLCEVVKRDERAALLEVIDEFMRHFAVIEVVGIGGDTLQGARELGLLEGFAAAVIGSVALKQEARFREARKIGIGEFVGLFWSKCKAIAGEA